MKTIYIKKVYPRLAYPVDNKKKSEIFGLKDTQKYPGFSGRIYVAGRCSSSLDLAWALMDEGEIRTWDSVLCLEQWAGRGQLRRTWVSPAGNIYAAWSWPALPAKWKPQTSILAGYIFARALAELGAEVKVKWPNDLLFQGKKVGGVLVEEKKDKVMVGFGLNVASSPDRTSLRDDTVVEAGNLGRVFGKLNPIMFWGKLVYKSYNWYMHILSHYTLGQFTCAVTKLLAYLGQEVAVGWGKDIKYGQVLGLDVDGSLLLKNGSKLVRVTSGSIMLEDAG
ncbi:biotin--[acetyl-CoA-carboxylase] ligase [Desulfohalobiaceae bacterium Ax17]|uniref:biotin--[acetyl-CoA-carboxylase] ligase n=1 Tax=Desulfovulcanus ferrireducens TaxID=2831190 RepID=UPI00207BC5CA|nr:biotin--[acetyl-CoA-carboxylase] ligase [Desulfovulcanus ferrireducens]MBT8762504.1 biotin--[acetyl-CoA-carboxylase] ligase [Desulfovulcanus ferrireducens]